MGLLAPVNYGRSPLSVARRSQQKSVGFLFLCNQSFGQCAPVVLRHAVLPLQEVGDALRFNADFHSPQTRQQKIHLVLEPDRGTQILRRRLNPLNLAPPNFQQPPSYGKFLVPYQTPRRQVIPLTADARLRLLPKALGAIGQKIAARHLALDQHRMARLFPPNSIRHLATDTSLLAEHHSAAIPPQPPHRHRNQFCVSHKGSLGRKGYFAKCQTCYPALESCKGLGVTLLTISLDSLRKQVFGFFQFGATSCTQTASPTIYEVGQHAQTRDGPLRRNSF